jgi:hypothetical protein
MASSILARSWRSSASIFKTSMPKHSAPLSYFFDGQLLSYRPFPAFHSVVVWPNAPSVLLREGMDTHRRLAYTDRHELTLERMPVNLTIKFPDEDASALTAKATARVSPLSNTRCKFWSTTWRLNGFANRGPAPRKPDWASFPPMRSTPKSQRRGKLGARPAQFDVTALVSSNIVAGLTWEESMTITLDIRPEVQAELARQAAAQGCAIEAVAATLLEEAVHLPTSTASRAPAKNLVELSEPIRGLLTDEEIDVIFSRNPSTSRPIDLS